MGKSAALKRSRAEESKGGRPTGGSAGTCTPARPPIRHDGVPTAECRPGRQRDMWFPVSVQQERACVQLLLQQKRECFRAHAE